MRNRLGLGCMRLSTDVGRDDARGIATVRAALDAGIRIFDTARAYALDDADLGHNERLLARALDEAAARGVRDTFVITKGGMRRPDGRWLVDGRAKSIVADCEASRAALGAHPIDLYLLHAPDPSVPFATSVRALVTLLERDAVRAIGLSNPTRTQLDEALALTAECGVAISAVEVSLSWFDDSALKNGVVARCVERGIRVIAHRPLGGVAKQRALHGDRALKAVARKHGVSNAAIALAALMDLHELVVPIPGCTTPEHAHDVAQALRIVLDDDDRAALAPKLARDSVYGPRAPHDLRDDGSEVVLLMGIQGAGKTEAIASWTARGYTRLNRDDRGGTMKQLHRALDETLRAAGAATARVVLDNTYVTRKVRRDAIDTAWRHRVPVRGVWFETPLPSAQVNVVLRMLRAHGRLLEPHEMIKAGSPDAIPPSAQHRLLRTLEPPSLDEGYAQLDVVPFVRRPSGAVAGRAAVGARFIALDALLARDDLLVGDVPHLVYAWRGARKTSLAEIEARYRGRVPLMQFVECAHPAGPPICWCRPPLPGLLLAFAHAHGIDTSQSVVVGRGPVHRAIAQAIEARFEEVPE